MSYEAEPVNVSFRKFPAGDTIAFISGYHCNRGYVMSYQHVGQHGEADEDLQYELEPASPAEYADLLKELTNIGYDVTIVSHVKAE